MRITTKGQVTIPQAIRQAAGLLPHTEVTFLLDEDGVRIVKATPGTGRAGRGAMLVADLEGRGNHKWTTDEIMALTRGD